MRRYRPLCRSEFAPDVDAARQIVAAALADGRQWLDPVEIKRLFDAYDIPMVPTFAAADAEQAVAQASELFAQGATVVLKIMSRDIVHKSESAASCSISPPPMPFVPRPVTFLRTPAKLRPEARI